MNQAACLLSSNSAFPALSRASTHCRTERLEKGKGKEARSCGSVGVSQQLTVKNSGMITVKVYIETILLFHRGISNKSVKISTSLTSA